jgi:hypothetical protein
MANAFVPGVEDETAIKLVNSCWIYRIYRIYQIYRI